jgi:NAD(P)-dependent dehydrogenase (short-subunit alcohol dehydrogenase family)
MSLRINHSRRTQTIPEGAAESDWDLFDGFINDVHGVLRSWGRERSDYLVTNAGTSLHKPFDQTTEAEFDRIVNVHFKGVYFLTQRLLPLMNDDGRRQKAQLSAAWPPP